MHNLLCRSALRNYLIHNLKSYLMQSKSLKIDANKIILKECSCLTQLYHQVMAKNRDLKNISFNIFVNLSNCELCQKMFGARTALIGWFSGIPTPKQFPSLQQTNQKNNVWFPKSQTPCSAPNEGFIVMVDIFVS